MVWLEKDVEFVKKYYKKYNKDKLLSELNYRYTWEAVKQRARKLGVTRKNKKSNRKVKWSDDKIKLFKELWFSGDTKTIQNEFNNFTYEALTSAARRFGVKRDENLRYKNKLFKLLKETNYNYYWLGFIIADGHLSEKNELKITLSVIDYNYLKEFADYLNIKIHTNQGCTYGKYTSNDVCTISVMDVVNLPILKERFKINNNKTYNPCSLDCLNTDEKFLSFFCGLVDGDGTISNSKTGKTNMLRIECHGSWLNIMSDIKDRFNKTYGFNFKCYINNKGYAILGLYRNKEINEIKNKIDTLNLPYMLRKWGKIN